MKLENMTKEINVKIAELINNMLTNEIKNTSEVIRLKELYPALNKIIFIRGWSGFNDGDEEYAICYPAWNSDTYLYRGDEFQTYDGENIDDKYFLNALGNYDEYEFDVKPSEEEFDAVHAMTEKNRKEFIALYDVVCQEIFEIVHAKYEDGTTVVIDV